MRATVSGGAARIEPAGFLAALDKTSSRARQVIVHVLSGDRPAVLLNTLEPGGEVLEAVAHDGIFRIEINGAHVADWPYQANHAWWRISHDVERIAIETSPDGVTWTPVGSHAAALAGAVDELLLHSLANARSPLVVDRLVWQDVEPPSVPSIPVDTGVLDDGARPDEFPLSAGGQWDTPGFPDHSTVHLSGGRIVGTSINGSAVWRTPFGASSEVWATVGAPVYPTTEYTLFAAMDADLGRRAGYDCWILGDRLWVARFDPPYSGYPLVDGMPVPGGGLQPGDTLALVVRDGWVGVALRRAEGAWQPLVRAWDDTYTAGGQIGFGLIDLVEADHGSFTAFGGGDSP